MITIGRDTRLFFDASVLIAGARSPTGGSALLLETCRQGGFRAVVSQAVLIEVGRNIPASTVADAYARFRDYLTSIPWDLVPAPAVEVIQTYEHLIHPKDAHVLAAALGSHCEFLLTLDRRDFMTQTLQEAALPIIILSPGEFIRRFYPLHPDYSSLRAPRGA